MILFDTWQAPTFWPSWESDEVSVRDSVTYVMYSIIIEANFHAKTENDPWWTVVNFLNHVWIIDGKSSRSIYQLEMMLISSLAQYD